jgi:hypothetical protein
MHFFTSHYGTMVFRPLNDKQSELDYTITIGIKFRVLSKFLLNAVAADIKKKLVELNRKLTENPHYSV